MERELSILIEAYRRVRTDSTKDTLVAATVVLLLVVSEVMKRRRAERQTERQRG